MTSTRVRNGGSRLRVDADERAARSDGHDVAAATEEAVEAASEHFEALGRAGWVAKGVVYGLLGILFIQVATSSPAEAPDEANQAGAMEAVAETPLGTVLLVVLAAGLALYAIWRLFTVILPGDWTGRALLDRLGYLVSTIVYSALLFTIVGLIRTRDRAADEREDRIVEDLVKDVLSVTAGRTLVVVAGLVVIGIGAVFAHKGATLSFRSQLERCDGVEGGAIDHLGRVGWIARGISMALIGAFLIRAAQQFDPEEAAGLDDSIRQLTGSWWGVGLALVVGAGFVAFGVFCVLSARHRKLEGPTNDDR